MIHAGGPSWTVRRARREDVGVIVELLAADQIGRTRDGGDLEPYLRAFAHIEADPAQLLAVAEDADGEIVGTLQLTFIPGLARRGALRMQIEGMRVHEPLRGAGLGGALLDWAVEQARERGCALVQLTSDKRRGDAHRFYARHGFVATHEGFKLRLD